MELKIRKIEEQKNEGVDEMSFTKRMIFEMQKQEEELFITALRIMAEPPIKGEITKGKITWRGIKIIRQNIGFDTYSWLEQREKQISPKFHIEAKFPESIL